MALERIILNIIPAGEMPVFHCSQYETGRPVIIDLVSSDDDAFLVGEGVSVELHCRKVDDNIVTLEPDEVDSNTVTFVSTEQLTACPGDNLCELVLYADTDPVQTIATLNFILHVEPDPLVGGLTSETQIYNLTEQIEEITQQVIGDDYYNKTEVDGLLADKADQATTYTKSEVDTALNLKADKATTYTKTQVDSALALKADKSDTYTKTQVDNALALKANTSDLATVATTGDYDDLINKPTIPAAQVQSDYAQADNTQVDYIKNKPDINAMIAAALLEVMPVDSATGDPATFDTEIAAPLVNVSCDIVATGGNGTPGNPISINGYTEANITRCGVNLWDEETELGYINTNTGLDGNTNNELRSKSGVYYKIAPNTTYYLVRPVTGVMVLFYDENKTYTGSKVTTTGVFTTPNNAAYFRITLGSSYGTTYNNDISINYPSTDTTYHAYNGQTYTVAFGQSVYGGVLDVTRGKLHVTHSFVADMGDLTWTYEPPTSNYPGLFRALPTPKPKLSGNIILTCYLGVVKGTSQIDNLEGAITGTEAYPYVRVRDDAYTDATLFTASVSGQSMAYELATPFDIDLTPEVISAIVGTNNVYSDTNGDTTVQYKDSIQHYIDSRV